VRSALEGRLRPLGRALPVSVGLVPGESVTALLRRLARANHLTLRVLKANLAPPPVRGRVDLVGIAALSGHSVDALEHALFHSVHPFFAERRQACPRCLARRGITGPIVTAVPNYRPLCRRHRIWLADASDQRTYYDLRPVPDVIAANHKHQRWIRHHGHTPDAQKAWTDALAISFQWTEHRTWPQHRCHRLQAYGEVSIPSHHPLIPLVNYPETVELAHLFTDPALVHAVRWLGPDGVERLAHAVGHRLRIPYQPYSGDPLLTWAEQQRRSRGPNPPQKG
jgi:TniQ